jgi:hypothetical protein
MLFGSRLLGVVWVYCTTLPGFERSQQLLDMYGHAQLFSEENGAFNNANTLLLRLLDLERNSSEHEKIDRLTIQDAEEVECPLVSIANMYREIDAIK